MTAKDYVAARWRSDHITENHEFGVWSQVNIPRVGMHEEFMLALYDRYMRYKSVRDRNASVVELSCRVQK
jgi:hypothetical protein